MKEIMVLASGRGSDFQSIVDHIKLGVLLGARVRLLVVNHKGTLAESRARRENIACEQIEGVSGKHFSSPEAREQARREFDSRCLEYANREGIDLIVLAGFDQLLSNTLVAPYANRILNIHPAFDVLQFGGRNMVGRKVHEAVLASGASYSGCTIHLVTSALDQGPPILRKKVPVIAADTAESLEARVLEAEHLAYPKAIQLLVDDRVKVSSEAQYSVDLSSGNWEQEWEKRQQKYLDFIHPREEQKVGLET